MLHAFDADELVLHCFLRILNKTDRQPVDRTSDVSRYRLLAFILNAHHIVCLLFCQGKEFIASPRVRLNVGKGTLPHLLRK